jgi:predicted tellurium resistance membrane protein TerC
MRAKARAVGLSGALLMRIALLFTLSHLAGMKEPVIWPLARFVELAEYRTFIGAKRLRTIGVCP